MFLTDEEVIFVFGVPDGPQTLEAILADQEFWAVVSSWEYIAAGPPRLASVAYDWHASPQCHRTRSDSGADPQRLRG